MPKFLEQKLKKEYGNNKHAIYGTMNKIGAMKGNKETAKGKEMEKKHETKTHHSGKGTRARLNTAADKMFFGNKRSK